MLARGQGTVHEVAGGIGVTAGQLYRWHRRYSTEVSGATQSTEDRKRSEDLRRRVRELERENAILKKAAAFFAKEIL